MIVRHIASHVSMKESGPEASAPTPLTAAPAGRIVEKSMPTPPPCCRVTAASRRCSKIPGRLSGMVPITKQLNSVTFLPVPAPARMRPAGMKRKLLRASLNRVRHCLRTEGFSARATASATRSSVADRSASSASADRKRYFAPQISSASGISKGICPVLLHQWEKQAD